MKNEYNFSEAKRDPVVPVSPHQTEIRLQLDTETLEWLKERVDTEGSGSYQNMLNAILRTLIQTQADATPLKANTKGQQTEEGSRADVFASAAKTTISDKEIVEIAARYLKDKRPGGATLEALTQGVRHEQDWWYVPVRPSFEPPRRYEYYEALADAEGELEDEEHLTVLFLPTAPEGSHTERIEKL